MVPAEHYGGTHSEWATSENCWALPWALLGPRPEAVGMQAEPGDHGPDQDVVSGSAAH